MNKLPSFDLVERARALSPLILQEADEIERYPAPDAGRWFPL